jgi:hypothetical protein
MTLHVINGGESPEPEASPVEPNNSAPELYQEFGKTLNAGSYTNGAVFTACVCLMAHAADGAGWKRQDVLPEIVRMYFQVEPIPRKEGL